MSRLPSLVEIGDPIRARHINDLVRAVGTREDRRLPNEPAGTGRRYSFDAVITAVSKPAGAGPFKPGDVTYTAAAMGFGWKLEAALAQLIGRPSSHVENVLEVFPAAVGDPCRIWRMPKAVGNSVVIVPLLEVITERLAPGEECDPNPESAGASMGDCACNVSGGGGLPPSAMAELAAGVEGAIASGDVKRIDDELERISRLDPSVIQRMDEGDPLRINLEDPQRIRIDTRGMKTLSIAVRQMNSSPNDWSSETNIDATVKWAVPGTEEQFDFSTAQKIEQPAGATASLLGLDVSGVGEVVIDWPTPATNEVWVELDYSVVADV